MSFIYFIMGKSASGKDHIVDSLLSDTNLNLKPVILYTTRPMREAESDGVEYHFINDEEEKELMASGKVIEERVYNTVKGPWKYLTVDDGAFDLKEDLLAIGTLEAYKKYIDYFGVHKLIPIYIEVEDITRLKRAIQREEKQVDPDIKEVCRRYMADEEDFAKDKLIALGINKFFKNDGPIEDCIDEIKSYIASQKSYK